MGQIEEEIQVDGEKSGGEDEAPTLLETLTKDGLKSSFQTFAESQHSEENLAFWWDVEEYRQVETSEGRLSRAKDISAKFIAAGAEFELCAPDYLKDIVFENIERESVATTLFDDLQAYVFKWTIINIYEQFLSSSEYYRYRGIPDPNAPPPVDDISEEPSEEEKQDRRNGWFPCIS